MYWVTLGLLLSTTSLRDWSIPQMVTSTCYCYILFFADPFFQYETTPPPPLIVLLSNEKFRSLLPFPPISTTFNTVVFQSNLTLRLRGNSYSHMIIHHLRKVQVTISNSIRCVLCQIRLYCGTIPYFQLSVDRQLARQFFFKHQTYLQTLGVSYDSFLLQVADKSVTESGADYVPHEKHSDERTCEQKKF